MVYGGLKGVPLELQRSVQRREQCLAVGETVYVYRYVDSTYLSSHTAKFDGLIG